MASSPNNYLPVRINTLKPTTVLGFNLYIQLPSKYLLYIRNDDSIEQERLDSLKQRKVKKLYINDKDEDLYQDFLDRCLNQSLNDTNLSLADKTQVVVDIADESVEKIYDDPDSQKSFKSAEKTSDILNSVLNQNEEILKEMLSAAHDGNADLEAKMRKHSLNVSSICIKFAQSLGFTQEDVKDLAVAGLYHDVSFVQYSTEDKELFFKSDKLMTTEEKVLYRAHPQKSYDLLKEKDFISKQILDLVLTHEERQDAQGFPNKIPKLTLKQEIFALACCFDYRITCRGEKMADVAKNLTIDEMGKFELDTLKRFQQFLSDTKLNI